MQIVMMSDGGNVVAAVNVKDEDIPDFLRISEMAHTFRVSRQALYKLYKNLGSWEAVFRHYTEKAKRERIASIRKMRDL